ncbi:hypothetical protein TNCV_1878731 [Trichonephila clavipes]|nr:hypothetical protein TNCV_1878731 [Trichonephila clavipes]
MNSWSVRLCLVGSNPGAAADSQCRGLRLVVLMLVCGGSLETEVSAQMASRKHTFQENKVCKGLITKPLATRSFATLSMMLSARMQFNDMTQRPV